MKFRTVVGILSHEAFLEIQRSMGEFMYYKRRYKIEQNEEIISATARYIYNNA